MPSADTGETTDTDTADTEIVDEGRTALLEAVSGELGDAVVATHLVPGRDLWIRVANDAWADTADYLRNRQRFRFFDWLSAIDWLPSPYGRSLDAEVDKALEPPSAGDEDVEGAPTAEAAAAASAAGGETRFQVIARVGNLATKLSLTLKADVDAELAIATWTDTYPGADWHEREAWEMFGIRFIGHPGLRNLYLPTDFEGHPLRKDFPLLARLVKPWPGIVDVEPMPTTDDGPTADEGAGPATTNPEDAS
ncbi:MAG: NADH-quinone oxidoreductase subunit C [Acidimicrobiales bacterium]